MREVANELRPPTPCLPCVRGGAERMRSGGVVGLVQEKAACYRKPVPIRYLQPLSQTLRVCQLPLHRGAKPRGGTAKRSPAADAGLGYSKNHPLRGRTGGSGGHFALGIKAPRRPFCPLSAGGKWTNAPQNRFCGGPGRFDRLSRRTQRLPAAGRRHSPPKPALRADSAGAAATETL